MEAMEEDAAAPSLEAMLADVVAARKRLFGAVVVEPAAVGSDPAASAAAFVSAAKALDDALVAVAAARPPSSAAQLALTNQSIDRVQAAIDNVQMRMTQLHEQLGAVTEGDL
eukprot:c47230_g1_i1.p4 GENE.c47230_g1_i1~~c47230_g1_i1.p4  ORF type:complete len:112 (+),score=24.28 c47230_g1_i1:104-439(+)